MSIKNLDLDLLRSFAAVAELGSISAAAQRIGRTQSAVSLQMDRLAEQLGFPVVERKGRGVALTPRGAAFLDDARRLLDLNDRVLGHHLRSGFSEPLRLGFVQDVAESALQRILARLGSLFPGAPITVRVCSTNTMIEKLRIGELDLAAGYRVETDVPTRLIMREQMCWIGARSLRLDPEEPVPLLMFESPCIFRSAAISALTAAGRSFRIALTSPSLPGVMAAVGAGLGITLRSARSLRPDLMTIGDLGTQPLPHFEYALYSRAESRLPALDQIEQVIEEELRRERPLFAVA